MAGLLDGANKRRGMALKLPARHRNVAPALLRTNSVQPSSSSSEWIRVLTVDWLT